MDHVEPLQVYRAIYLPITTFLIIYIHLSKENDAKAPNLYNEYCLRTG